MNRKIWAKVKTQFEGIHCYPKAPQKVNFLRNAHRHIFYVTVWIEQYHNERDVEFILFKRFIEQIIKNSKFPREASCETISDFLANKISRKYRNRSLKIEILEDNENGALIEYDE